MKHQEVSKMVYRLIIHDVINYTTPSTREPDICLRASICTDQAPTPHTRHLFPTLSMQG
jgi:hypothetical protein